MKIIKNLKSEKTNLYKFMLSSNLFISSIISIFFTWLILKISIPFFKINIIDKPNSRSSHSLPKPTGGGISFVFIISIFGALNGFYLPLKCLPLAIIGLLDDLFKIPRSLRFYFQLFTVLYLFLTSSSLDIINENFSGLIYFFIFTLVIISGTAIINFVNFMDGIDGIVTGSLIIIFFLGAILINPNFLIVVGSLIGFIVWNWQPSKIFMGDVGSTYLGALLVGLLLDSSNLNTSMLMLISSAPLIGDSLICILRRFFNHQKIFNAHSSHLYQRLFQAGWNHSSVAILYMSCILLLSITIIIGGIKFVFFLMTLEYLLGFWLDQKVAIPFKSSIQKI